MAEKAGTESHQRPTLLAFRVQGVFGIYLRCSSSGSLAMLAAIGRTKILSGTCAPFVTPLLGRVVASRSPGRHP
jgi:hypothetical protein